MDEFIAVLRGSAAIAVPTPAQQTETDEEGFYLPGTNRHVRQMKEAVAQSRAYRKGVK